MNKIYKRWLRGGLLGLAVTVGLASCSDDHYDLNTTNASKTLWQNIVAPENNVDSFAMILAGTKVTKNENDKKSTVTYEGLLNSSQVFTVWAPANGTYNAKYWLNLLAEGKNQIVEKRFVRNHVARFNYAGSYPEVLKVGMLNAKENVYNVTEGTFAGVALQSGTTRNIASTNGTLHELVGPANFAPNLYEYMATEGDLSDMYAYVHSKDTTIFSESSSTPGATVNGYVQYVDSVFKTSNKLLGNYTTSEDSLYIAVYPKNGVWIDAKTKINGFFNYPSNLYYYSTASSKVIGEKLNADSLKEIKAMGTLTQFMYFSLNCQPGFDPLTATVSSVKSFVDNADSLVVGSSSGSKLTTIKKPYCQKIVGSATPVRVSNGFVYSTDQYNYIANATWEKDNVIECENTQFFDTYNSAKIKVNSTTKEYIYDTYTVNATNRNDTVIGNVSNNQYKGFEAVTPTSKTQVSYKLPYLYAGTYDIYVVIVPEHMAESGNKSSRTNLFKAWLSYFDEAGKAVTVDANNSQTFETTPNKVDTVLLFKDYKMPYSTIGLETSKIGTTLVLQCNAKATLLGKYTNSLYLDCIILKGKDE